MGALVQSVKVRRSFPDLESLGIATQLFSPYVNLKPEPHKVDVLLLSFIVRGEATHLMDGEAYREKGVSLSVTSCAQSHSIVTGPDGIEILNIYVNPDGRALPALPEPLNHALAALLPAHAVFQNRLNRLLRISFERPEAACELALGLHEELQAKRPGWELAALDRFRLFMLECARSALSCGVRLSAPAAEGPSSARLERLRRRLDADYMKKFSLAQMARIAGLNRNYLCRAFKAYAGRSPFDYLAGRRLQAAMLALRNSDAKVSAVAFDCGFNDLSFFNRKFKELSGLPPSEWRREARRQAGVA